jgi:hypothetical protein
MSRGGLVIGLGGSGLRVVARLRQVLVAGGQARMPEAVRLLAFDVLKPAPATAKLPQSYYFLVQLPPLESAKPARQAARDILLQDLAQGAVSSLTLRGLAAQFDALRRVRVDDVDIFLVCSSFGATGTAWLLDLAYLVRHMTQKRMKVRVHAVLIAPEAFERTFFPTAVHQMTNFTVLKELESLQRERNWGNGVSIYDGKYVGSLPGLLTARPFDSVQVLDGLDLSTSPESGAIPAAADGILCQLDAQAGDLLEQATRGVQDNGRVFSTFGVFSLVYPVRLVLEQSIQRLLIGTIDQLVPLEKDPDTGRPLRVAEPVHLRPDEPYGKLQSWLPDVQRSGVLQDVLREADALADSRGIERRAFHQEIAERSPSQWTSLFLRCEGVSVAEPFTEVPLPLVQGHVRAFLKALTERITAPDPHLGAPLEYLEKLERGLSTYLQNLDAVQEAWRKHGDLSESDARRSVEDARKELEQRRTSLLGRLAPQGVQGAQERYNQARLSQVTYRQREVTLTGLLQTATLLRVLTHRLLLFGQRMLAVLALLPDSVYNMALDQSGRLDHEARFEAAVRTQQMVIDQGFETRQARLVFAEFSEQLSSAVGQGILSVAGAVDWQAQDLRLPFRVADPDLEGVSVDLDDPDLTPERLAVLLNRSLSMRFADALLRSQPNNTVVNFLHYLDPRADRLGGRLVNSSAPLARLLNQPLAKRNILFAPRPNSPAGTDYSQLLLSELQHLAGNVHVIQTMETDRLTLFRYFDGLELDNLLTYHQSEPRRLDPVEMKNYILWDL